MTKQRIAILEARADLLRFGLRKLERKVAALGVQELGPLDRMAKIDKFVREIEQALTPHWSVVADYKYVDLGTSTLAFTVPAAYLAVASESVSRTAHLVTLGANYRFDPTGAR